MEEHWKRIAGVYIEGEGSIGAVWCALDPDTDLLHVYDACVFTREVWAVIAEGINARGRWIPIAWEDKAKHFADHLLDRGCNMLPEGVNDDEAMAEVTNRELWERMRSKRIKANSRLQNWKDELTTFQKEGGKIPRDSHPLMTATRLAVGALQDAKRQHYRKRRKEHQRMAII